MFLSYFELAKQNSQSMGKIGVICKPLNCNDNNIGRPIAGITISLSQGSKSKIDFTIKLSANEKVLSLKHYKERERERERAGREFR